MAEERTVAPSGLRWAAWECETQVWDDPQLAAQIRAAVVDAEAGRVVDLGDLARYAPR